MVNSPQDGEQRKAEVLSIQTRQGKPKFYVHYEEFNKRLDEWIAAERINLSREVEWPAPDKPEKKKAAAPKTEREPRRPDPKNLKRSRSKLDREIA
jgi:histone acetyltransferase HTATIP